MPTDYKRLISRLVELYVDHPKDLQLACQASDDGSSRYWVMKGNQLDNAKLIGTQGTHVDSLDFVVRSLGLAIGETWSFRMITPAGSSRSENRRVDVLEYDTKAATQLLADLLVALKLNPLAMNVGPGEGPRDTLAFRFMIIVKTSEDYERLTIPNDKFCRDEKLQDMTLIGSLGTLFRAIAKNAGVKFALAVGRAGGEARK